jgi:ectoine hydroxylase-related dioxygenase (phytanoyl-CoA dioxygenase family)
MQPPVTKECIVRRQQPVTEPLRTLPAQIDAKGFAIIERVFETREIDSIAEALYREPLPRSRAGARHAMQCPLVANLARDPRLLNLARHVLGPDAVPYRATLFDKLPTANWLVVWHQDTALPLRERADVPGWGPWSVKAGVNYAHAPAAALRRVLALRIHLDDSTEANGPLRVIPGTHERGVLTDEALQSLAQEITPVDCMVGRGGVLAMRPLIAHASSKSRTDAPRRVLHVEYAASLNIEPGLQLAVA